MTKDHRRPDTQMAQGVLLDDPGFLREIVERVLQEILEAEMTEHLGAARYERTDEAHRATATATSRARLSTRVGTLELRVPQDREGTFSTRLFARYQRNEQALVLALMEMYVQGVSTRKVTEITEQLCGTSFSKSLVSALAGRLDAELAAWRSRPLEAEGYPYLIVDARYEQVRVDGRVVSQGVLVVAAVRDGRLGRSWRWRWPTPRARRPTRSCSARLKARGPFGRGAGGHRRPRGPEGGHRAALPGGSWQTLPGPLRAESARDGWGQASARSSAAELRGDLRRARAGEPALGTLCGGRSVAREGHREGREHVEEHIEECLACFAFPERTAGASAPPTAWNGSTRS